MEKKFCLLLKILSFLVILFFFQGCTKKDSYRYVPDEFKPWSYYKPGSYWIYLNEKSGVQDCTYVTDFTSGMHSYRSGEEDPVTHSEYAEAPVAGNLYQSFEIVATRTSTKEAWVDDAFLSIPLSNPGMGQVGFSYLLLKKPGYTLYSVRPQFDNYGVFAVDSLEYINGTAFTDIYILRHEWMADSGDTLLTEAYLVKSMGIVKLRMDDGQADTTWSLLRWRIIQ
jgi:hypothetical protein